LSALLGGLSCNGSDSNIKRNFHSVLKYVVFWYNHFPSIID